jgi:5-hydroxyisourate hydrolase
VAIENDNNTDGKKGDFMSTDTGGRLTTHVLDTASGKPAQGLKIELYRIDGDKRALLKTVSTNDDGRVDAPLMAGDSFQTGEYELVFFAGDYLRGQGTAALPGFSRHRTAAFRHGGKDALPCAAADFPYSYSTYRGS